MSRIVSQNKEKLRILVAEDDQFQRLSLIDFLSLCSFDVTAVENGVFARDELLKEESNYDLVLLDLMMPQLDGLELLSIMKSIPKLKNIPVIMMSSDGEMEIVALCMEKGAADYIIKPIRIQNVKDFKKHINTDKQKQKASSNDQFNYEKLQLLGRGAAGSVELVRRSHDGVLFALKTIQMHFMNASERKLAENEITLLKVLKGPNIIRYYDSFIENDSIHIVMEYAEGGALNDKITENKQQGKLFSKNQIFTWMAHIILGIMNMHSKNILHRDIKTQNMFLTKDNIIKLGDFGIAKALGTQVDFAKTFLGTPQYMSPEVCKGNQYGQKADIWAIGCVLYELVTFKRPFNHDLLAGVFDVIINKDYAPLPKDTDPEMVNLINMMLQKDPDLRPNVYKLMEIEIINQYVRQFIQSQESGNTILESYMVKKQNQLIDKDSKDQTILKNQESFIVSQQFTQHIKQLYPLLKQQITYQSLKTGFFHKTNDVFSGQSIYDLISKQKDIQDVSAFCKSLLVEKIIVPKVNKNKIIYNQSCQEFQKSDNYYYKFTGIYYLFQYLKQRK